MLPIEIVVAQSINNRKIIEHFNTNSCKIWKIHLIKKITSVKKYAIMNVYHIFRFLYGLPSSNLDKQILKKDSPEQLAILSGNIFLRKIFEDRIKASNREVLTS